QKQTSRKDFLPNDRYPPARARRKSGGFIQTKNAQKVNVSGMIKGLARLSSCMKKILFLSSVLLGAIPASQAGIHFGIGIDLPLPVPPPLVISRPPPVVV